MSTSLATALQEWKVQEKELQQLQVGYYLSESIQIQNRRPYKTTELFCGYKTFLCPGDPSALPAEVGGSLQTSKKLCCLHISTEKEFKGQFRGFVKVTCVFI